MHTYKTAWLQVLAEELLFPRLLHRHTTGMCWSREIYKQHFALPPPTKFQMWPGIVKHLIVRNVGGGI